MHTPGVWSDKLDTWINDPELVKMLKDAFDLNVIVTDLHDWLDSTNEEDPEPWSALASLEDHVKGLESIAASHQQAIERRHMDAH